MKNRYLLAVTLGAVILALSSCEKDGGRSSSNGSRTASDNIPLASFATLYSYIGRTDIENIAQRFRDEGYTVNINYPEVEQGDQTGQIYAEIYYNSGNGSAYGYTLYFNLENIISRCRYKLYKAKARDEISNILGDQLQFCRNWTQTSFRASIWQEGANHIDFSTEEEFQAGLVEINGPTEYIRSYTIYDNGFSLEIECNYDVNLWYEIERVSMLQD